MSRTLPTFQNLYQHKPSPRTPQSHSTWVLRHQRIQQRQTTLQRTQNLIIFIAQNLIIFNPFFFCDNKLTQLSKRNFCWEDLIFMTNCSNILIYFFYAKRANNQPPKFSLGKNLIRNSPGDILWNLKHLISNPF